MVLDPEVLVAGPRGRRLCLQVAIAAGDEALSGALFYASHAMDPGRGSSRVLFGPGRGETTPEPTAADVARLLDVASLPEPDPTSLLRALQMAVDMARYWQEPDGEDVLVATPELHDPLLRIAETIVGSAAAAWWTTPIERDAQWQVTFPGVSHSGGPPVEVLRQWRSEEQMTESRARRERPVDPTAMWSGAWWSAPPRDLSTSTRCVGDLGPAGLWLVEDSMGWETAVAAPVTVPEDFTVYEIDGPEAWARLCRTHPLDVSAERRHDWYRTTGRDGPWCLPDWSQVALDYDAVHLSVAGYLTTAGRAIEVTDAVSSVLAGWSPDHTHWLRDITTRTADSISWQLDHDGRWSRGA